MSHLSILSIPFNKLPRSLLQYSILQQGCKVLYVQTNFCHTLQHGLHFQDGEAKQTNFHRKPRGQRGGNRGNGRGQEGEEEPEKIEETKEENGIKGTTLKTKTERDG